MVASSYAGGVLQTFLNGSLSGFFSLLSLGILGLKLFALVDAARRPGAVWRAAVAQSKNFWLVLLGLSLIVGLLFGTLGLFGIGGLVATILYLVDVRPKLREVRGGGW